MPLLHQGGKQVSRDPRDIRGRSLTRDSKRRSLEGSRKAYVPLSALHCTTIGCWRTAQILHSFTRPIDGSVVYAIIQLFVICESNAWL